ncbi:MAG: ECF-type riboflavin transporter substrate-binding protein [Pleomorphochaeta sp.]
MNNNSVKTVVLVAIGAALYGLGGMICIPIFAEVTIKPAMAILALFAGVWGPLVGFFVGFVGHWITDLFMGWGVWPTWMLGSGIVGIVIGVFPKISKNCVENGEFGKKQYFPFISLAVVGNLVGYMISAVLDYFLFAEPLDKSIVQQLIASAANVFVIATLGIVLMKLVANKNKSNQNLSFDEDDD